MKIMVTGGAGYIGSHTVSALQEKGYEVVIYDNLSTGHKWAVRNCELVIGDLGNTKQLESVFDSHQISAVVHFAASSLVGESVSNPAKYYENNVIGSKRLFDVMLAKGVSKLVFSSTCATYGLPEVVPITENEKQSPINSYGWTKFMIERIMQDYGQAYGLNSIALRYFNAAGSAYEAGLGEAHSPESHVIPLLLETVTGKRDVFSLFGQDYNTEDGSCIRDYIHVKDLASAHILALERLLKNDSILEENCKSQDLTGFDCFNLGTGEGVSVLQLISTIEKVTGKNVPVRVCERREGDPPVLVAENRKAVKLLGWKPVYSDMENIIQSAYKWETMKAFCMGDMDQIANKIL
ncbi:UDP-glucose 4-epimerase GalE [Aminipila terrae]|uniref:UDP-glucose 4-epimerase n=1 Tax=Aminipila terrae TaxID=2697030 RepID=A0A6P1MK88_9FIRM|nr:UDP-glucose 4-epimerase GalE [Aminipila terrae]QHI72046.1 UDP-glucose 4-epimerase GalE [Aminipila terrae]